MGKGGNVAGWLLAPGAMIVIGGVKAHNAQKNSLRLQAQTIEDAKAAASAQQRQSEEAIGRANRKKPNVDSLLAGEMQASKLGAGASLLTGALGVDRSAMRLGKVSLLGG